MGGLLHLFDFHHGYIGRKSKKQGDVGVDAPHNSLELIAEPWQRQNIIKDAEQDLSERTYYPNDASMKNLIWKEMSKRSSSKQNAPSIVARLMGMDVLPAKKQPEVQSAPENNEKIEIIDKKVQHIEKVSAFRPPKKSKSSSRKERRSYEDSYYRYWTSGKNVAKPQPRAHPQEKELQKFKKDFESWQAVRFLECVRIVELGNIPEQWLAQLDLTKEKMTLYESSRKAVSEKTVAHRSSRLKSRSVRSVDFEHLGYKRDVFPSEHKESYSFSGRSSGRDFEHISLKDSDLYSYKSSVPAKIVILKPGPDSFSTGNDESWVTSTCSIEDRDCIEDLLGEVKERLRYKMQQTLRTGSMVRGGGIEIPYKEKPAYTKSAHQPIREPTSKDVHRKLLRSKSARPYRKEVLFNEIAPSSPELISRDTRKLLLERLRNVLDGENQHNY